LLPRRPERFPTKPEAAVAILVTRHSIQRLFAEIARKAGLARVSGASADELAAHGKKGGRARALTKEQRQETARKAAAARWGKKP
jgi:hypothetical protein